MLMLLENAEVYTPEPQGRTSVLLTDGKIGKVGEVNARALREVGVECEVVDLQGCLLVPGFIDPHQHLLGGSGESGFSTQTPEFFLSEIVSHGITSVVGVLGVDTTMKTMAGLLAKVKGLREEGMNAYLWTGGYDVPPASLLGSVRDDILYIEEVLGVGELAVSDLRAHPHSAEALARVMTDSYVAGRLARKSCRTHFHVGEEKTRLKPLREVLESYNVRPEWIYATHVERSRELMREALELVRRGAAIDLDVVEENLLEWYRYYRERDGDPSAITASSDAGLTSPRLLYEQVRALVREGGYPLEEVLPLITRNPARILRLERKGEIAKGYFGDLVALEPGTLEIVHVLSRGEWMVRDGALVREESWTRESNRTIHLQGKKGEEEEGG